MHSIIQNLEVKIYVVQKFKIHKIKNHSNLFRIICDPSSGSMKFYLTEIIRSGSQMFVVCLVGILQRNFDRTHTHHWFKITLQNTDQAHNKHLWTTTNNFSQVQLPTPWWWIAYDPKHVGEIFNFVSFKLFYNLDFNL